MSPLVAPVLYTLLVWWLSTGVLLWLVRLPRRTYPWTLAGATAVLAGALYGLHATAADTTPGGAYAAFTCALLTWAWQETAFLQGYVTGPLRTPCPPGTSDRRRAWRAFLTIAHHELVLVALAAAVLAPTWGAANPVAWWTFAVLWTMRQSAKLNLFLGVRNRSEAFLPDHLRYLGTYFGHRPVNALLPLSVALAIAASLPVWRHALAAGAGTGAAVGAALVGTLLAAAILEHLLMVAPFPSDGLWRWGLRPRRSA